MGGGAEGANIPGAEGSVAAQNAYYYSARAAITIGTGTGSTSTRTGTGTGTGITSSAVVDISGGANATTIVFFEVHGDDFWRSVVGTGTGILQVMF